ncbi:unnamed protein product [Tuber melanosporum]|uniref:(Perigord truffle) hypothetical protein n=1 Tax=Tuber melanosporum (strain Mel28) TaxID=656061 RepID=D5GMI3_TUBMM|nr:uncharacterized protein GSTUM_00010740001 [Tuber melanosporum]CAZ85726.1 unnamed protein product [Tuber melanosporum]
MQQHQKDPRNANWTKKKLNTWDLSSIRAGTKSIQGHPDTSDITTNTGTLRPKPKNND